MTKELKEFIKENKEQVNALFGEWFSAEDHTSYNDFIQEAIKEPILVTEDGEVYDPKQIIFTLDKKLNCDEYYANDCDGGGLLYFISKENRTAYILQNKPLTSVKEQVEAISALMSDDDGCYAPGTLKRIEDCLTALAQSKLK